MATACACSGFSFARSLLGGLSNFSAAEIRQALAAAMSGAGGAGGGLLGGVVKAAEEAVHGAERAVQDLLGREPLHLFHGGTIRTMADPASTAEAVLVKGNTIIAVGRFDDLRAQAPGATLIDLKQRTMLPGFVDPHMHLVAAAVQLTSVDLGPQTLSDYTIDTVKDRLREAIRKAPTRDTWILGQGFDPSLMYDPKTGQRAWRNLTVLDFDELFHTSDPDKQNPVLISAGSGHISFVSRRTLTLAGIDPANPPPIQGGKIATFDSGPHKGHASGILVEMPAQRVTQAALEKLPLPLIIEAVTLAPHLAAVMHDANAHGTTLVNDAAVGIVAGTKVERAIIETVSALNGWPLRIASAMYVDEWSMPKGAELLLTTRPDLSNPLFRKQAVKLFSDGSNQGVTGLQRDAYTQWGLDQARQDYVGSDTRGNMDLDPQTLTQIIGAANRNGWQVMVHSNGDQAIDNTVAAFAEAKARGDYDPALRHRVEHASILHDDTLAAMKDLGLSPSFLIEHATRWGPVLQKLLGEERANLLDRCRSAADAGMIFSLHSDHPVTPMRPLTRIQAAVTRMTDGPEGGWVLNPQERIPVELALMAQTKYSAWQCHMDDIAGSIEVGKMADFAILEQDPCAVDPNTIAGIKVHETWVNGRRVYKQAASAE